MDKKLEVLSRYFGYTQFRGAQEELIDAVLSGVFVRQLNSKI